MKRYDKIKKQKEICKKKKDNKCVEKMVTKTVTIRCPHCESAKISKNGHNKRGKQVYRCNNPRCQHKSFIEEYTNKAWDPKVRKQVLKLTIDCTGTRATGRILGISKDTVTAILKKQKDGHGR